MGTCCLNQAHFDGKSSVMNDQFWAARFGRRQFLRTGSLAATTLLGGPGLLSACTGSTNNPGESSSASLGKPVNGGTLIIGMMSGGQAESINPAIAIVYSDILRIQQLFEGLYQLGPDGNPQPWLAESAEPNADASVWTIRLQPDVTWHDGKPLTADDLLYTIQTWADPSSPLAGVAASAIDIKEVRKLDSRTVRVPLKLSYADFPMLTAMYYSFVVQQGSQHFKAMPQPVGTGPFVFKSFTPGSRSEFTANPDYWAGAPYLDSVVVDSSFGDDNTRCNALLSGAIDVAPLMPFALGRSLNGQFGVRVASAHTPQPYYLPCRIDLAPFKDPRVMQALKLVVDQRQIIDSAYNGFGATTPQIPLKGLRHFWEGAPESVQDIDKAKSLLRAAGYSDLRLELNTSSANVGFVETATIYASQAKKAGITVNVKKIDPTTYYNTSAAGGQWLDYPMMTESPGGGASIPSLPYFYLTNLGYKGYPNETHWGDPVSQRLTLDAVGETDPAKAAEKWQAIQQTQIDRGGFIFTGNIDAVDGFRSHVHGCDPTAAGTLNNNDLRKAWRSA